MERICPLHQMITGHALFVSCHACLLSSLLEDVPITRIVYVILVYHCRLHVY
jgi:hypothetical protein